MAIMATVPLRGRWEPSAYENQIIKLHSQIWLISEAVTFLLTEKKINGRQQREVCSPLKLCHRLTQFLSYGHSPGRKTISGCLYSTREISQGYKLSPASQFLSAALSRLKRDDFRFPSKISFFSRHITPFPASFCLNSFIYSDDAAWLYTRKT